MPGADGLLIVRRYPEPDTALVDEEAEAEVRARSPRRRSCAAGATASAPQRARSSRRGSSDGYDRTAEHIARLARVEWSADGGEPVATVGVPGGNVAVLASEAVDLEAAAAPRRRAAGHAREGDRARRGQARQPGLRRQGAGRGRGGRARQARPPAGGSWRSCSGDAVAPRGRRGPPALARAVRHALRPGAHAAAADRARQPAGAVRRRSTSSGTNGKSSTVRMSRRC